MELELLAMFGLAGLLIVVAFTIRGAMHRRRTLTEARANYQRTVERGILPPSLHPKVDLDLCIGSGTCVEVCPEVDVLAVLDGKATLVNPTACIGHGECMRACPVDAIQLVLGSERRGVDIPLLAADFQTSVPGLYIVGELGGMGLIYNATTQALQCVRGIVGQRLGRVEGAHQLVIVGAGPAGLAASLAAMEAKLDFVTLDQESVGGTVLHYPRHKVVMTQPVKLPLYGRLRVSEIRKEELMEIWEDIVAKTGLTVRSGVKVDGVTRGEDGLFEVRTADETLRAQRVILAMGRRGSPRKLGVPGEDQGKVVYRLVDPEAYAGRNVLVVGGGDSAVEGAIALGESGAIAHLSYRRKTFDRIKPKNQKRLDAAVAAGQVTLVVESQVVEVGVDTVRLAVGDQEQELPNDYVLVAIGGVLPTKFLQAAGVEVASFKGEVYAPANQ